MPAEGRCECGSCLPRLAALDGRVGETLVTRDGRPLGPNAVEAIFDAKLPIKEGQLIQETHARVTVLLVPADGFSEETKRTLERSIHHRMGGVEVSFEEVDRVPRGPGGKMRSVVSRVSPDPLPREGAGAAPAPRA